jgi:O-antigen/teichoic acid export membrane protein
MSEPDVAEELTAAEAAGKRAVGNTLLRAGGDVVGKLASLVLFAVMARELDATELGVFVFGLAFMQIAMLPVEFGYDPYLLRRVAKERSSIHALFFDVVALKLALTVPILAVAGAVLAVADYGAQTREVVAILAIGFVLDAVANTVHSVFLAHERNGLIAAVVVVQRLAAAAAGLTVLALGYGVVAVALTYTAAAVIGLVMAAYLMIRHVGLPRRTVSARGWARLTVVSLPFGLQDVFSVILFRLDTVILSLMATQAAVALYGGAYRLLEASMFVIYALMGAFTPMYTYLGTHTEPTVGAAFGRSVKLALMALVPIAAVLGVFADPVCRLLFGAGLEGAAEPLRVLAPVIVVIGVVTLASSLIVSRRNPMVIVWSTAAIVVVNVALNVALIPVWEETGAAVAMLVSEVALLAIVGPLATRAVGGVRWLPTVTGPLVAGAVMAGALLLLGAVPLAGVAVGSVAYLLALVTFERLVAPHDVQLATRIARHWLTARA